MTGDAADCGALPDSARPARLFWAVPVRGDIVAFAQAERDRLAPALDNPRIRWHPAENWHLTLLFLGNTQLATGLAMAEALRAPLAVLEPFVVAATAAEWFPSMDRPLVVALPVAATPPLQALAAVFVHAGMSFGLSREARPFRGHVSLARVKQGVHPRERLPSPDVEHCRAEISVRDVVLFESVSSSDGVRYRPLLSLPLRSG